MSYKITQFDEVDPDVANLSNLSDVDSSPTDTEGLSYDSASGNWETAPIPSASQESTAYFWSQTGASWRSAGGSGYAYSADTSASPPVELMQANYGPAGTQSGLTTDVTQYNWGLYQGWYSASYPRFSGFFVPSGTYLCRAVVAGTPYATSGYADVRFCTGGAVGSGPTTAGLTQTGPFFRHAIRAGRFCHVPTTIITTTASTTLIGVEFVAGSSFQYGYSSSWMKHYTFHIRKL